MPEINSALSWDHKSIDYNLVISNRSLKYLKSSKFDIK